MRYAATMFYIIIMLVGVSIVLYQYRIFVTWMSTQSGIQNVNIIRNSKYAELMKRELNRSAICNEKETSTEQLPVSTFSSSFTFTLLSIIGQKYILKVLLYY